jgi:ATP-dependent DNA helicase PIF1
MDMGNSALSCPQAPLTPDKASEAEDAVTAIRRGDAVLMITGRAGTGKSPLIHTLLESEGENQVILAPTGVAAVNVGGQTIHSFFRIPPRLHNPA